MSFRFFSLALLLSCSFSAHAGTIAGKVRDPQGRPVATAQVVLRSHTGAVLMTTDAQGRFVHEMASAETFTLEVNHEGYVPVSRPLSGQEPSIDVVLEPLRFIDSLDVVANRIAVDPAAIPGSVDILDRTDLRDEHVFTTAEALRKVAGINVRDEEGFGLRPNIGIRGLNPTRSSKVLLLEDGIPLAFAPYGDNASYYHPPVERFERIEVVKGSGQIAYGPSTIGGVINYVTPDPSRTPSLFGSLTAGSSNYSNAKLSGGGTWGRTGVHVDLMRKEGDGARENTGSLLYDVSAKLLFELAENHQLSFRTNWYSEDSQVTYSGLRQDEWEANARANPFANDHFDASRSGAALRHNWRFGDQRVLATTLYGSTFDRHWWRQSSNSNQRPNDSADPSCGGMANLNTTCGNEGRLRSYETWGIESKLRFAGRIGGLSADSEMGVRTHFEHQRRLQVNGDTPLARTGRVVEDNVRKNDAYAAFVQTRFGSGRWGVTPGVRVEQIFFERTNRLAAGGAGVSGSTSLTQVVPGVGLSYQRGDSTLFAGIHRGFAPPRTEDIINNTTGGIVDLDPELSWNSELGIRSSVMPGVVLSAALFRMDYENQIVPTSVAGGVGATLTNAGRTIHQGMELSSRLDSAMLFGTSRNFYTKLAWTWIPDAEFVGERFSSISGHSKVSVTGNRLPYAPEQLLTAGAGVMMKRGGDFYLEAVHVGTQFTDDLNSVTPTPDGQRGLIDAHTVLNATMNIPLPGSTSFFVAVKNLLDESYIVDRSRGILPGSGRLVHAGITFRR
jgi:Fe(3+) dicitrate transport protein